MGYALLRAAFFAVFLAATFFVVAFFADWAVFVVLVAVLEPAFAAAVFAGFDSLPPREARACSTDARNAAIRSTTVLGCSVASGWTTSRPSTLAEMRSCRASR